MSVFDDQRREDIKPKRKGEPLFAFYDRSARPEMAVFRDIVNRWVDEIPPETSKDIISRIQQGDDSAFAGAFAEVILWTALRNQGYEIELHPKVPNSENRPDMLVNWEHHTTGYVEITTMNPPRDKAGRDTREGEIQEALNEADIPEDLRLGYMVVDYGQSSPSKRRLVREVERWARDYAGEARKQVRQDDRGTRPCKIFEIDDWRFQIILWAGFRPNPEARSIALTSSGFRSPPTPEGLTSSLDKKAKRYGKLDHPYVIVVFDATGSLMLTEGGFASGVEDALKAWFGPKKQNNVSAVLVFPSTEIWQAAAPRGQPLLIRNPWATQTLCGDILPVQKLEFDGCRYHFGNQSGRLLAELLDLPAPWPPRG